MEKKSLNKSLLIMILSFLFFYFLIFKNWDQIKYFIFSSS